MDYMTLAECPPGLFETVDGHVGFKTEYAHKSEADGRYYPEAYVVESGEFFWGGVNTHPERAKLQVRPFAFWEAEQERASVLVFLQFAAWRFREWNDHGIAAAIDDVAERIERGDHLTK